MYRERIFYDETGVVIDRYAARGDLLPEFSAEADKAARGYDEGIRVLEFAEPDAERSANFAGYTGQTVVEGALVLGTEPIPVPEPEPDEYEQYYNAVSGEIGGTK